jgi:hypothetical protein
MSVKAVKAARALETVAVAHGLYETVVIFIVINAR